jgi:hypothetical protein
VERTSWLDGHLALPRNPNHVIRMLCEKTSTTAGKTALVTFRRETLFGMNACMQVSLLAVDRQKSSHVVVPNEAEVSEMSSWKRILKTMLLWAGIIAMVVIVLVALYYTFFVWKVFAR